MHYGREVKQGTFPTALLAVWRFAKCAPIWSKVSTSNTFSKHESSTAKSCISKWRCLSALVKSTSLALMSLEIQNRRLSPGIIVVKPRFKAPNSQTNAPSSSLSLVSPTFTPARLGVGGHLLGYQKMPGSDAYLPSHGTGSAWVGRNVCLFKKWTEYFPWFYLGNKPSYRGQISIRTLDERLFECFIPLKSNPLPPITHWYMLHNL